MRNLLCLLLVMAASFTATEAQVVISDTELRFGKIVVNTSGRAAYYLSGFAVTGIGSGDIDGDGKPDLVVASAYPSSVTLLTNDGSGRFRIAGTLPAGNYPNGQIIVADFNGDGRPDIAVANQNSADVSVYINQGGATFGPAATYPGFSTAFSLAAGDFNSDGKLDLAVASTSDRPILFGAADGTFSRGAPIGYVGYGGIVVADVNADGKLDLLTRYALYFGNGDGTFGAGIPSPAPGLWPSVGDFNGDGRLDVFTSLRTPAPEAKQGRLALGNGNGTFAAPVDHEAAVESWATAVADFNQDGLADAVINTDFSATVSVLFGDRVSGLRRRVNYGYYANFGSSMATADFNGDGIPDLAVGASGVGVLLGQRDGTLLSAQAVIARNAGTSIISVGRPSIIGANASEFVLDASSCPATLDYQGRFCFVNVYFAPTAAGPKTAVLRLTTSAGDTFDVALSGEGLPSDVRAPSVSVRLSPAPNAAGWNASSVTAEITAADEAGGSGLKEIRYWTSGAEVIGPFTTTAASILVPLTTDGESQLTVVASDNAGNTATSTAVIRMDKTAPTILSSVTPGPNAAGWNNTAVEVSWRVEDTVSGIAGVTGCAPATVQDSPGTTITCSAVNAAGLANSASVLVRVDKTAPTVTSLVASPNPVALNSANSLAAMAVDNGGSGVSTVLMSIEGGAPQHMAAADSGYSAALPMWTTAGVQSLCAYALDRAGNIGPQECTLLAVYDASAGFVTGGGWINSPAGAYAAAPSSAGRANFGFVSRYQRGASTPSGQTEFDFRAGNFNFHAEVYEWLVVSGPKAQYKGTGSVNGSGDYGFLLTVTDGDVPGGGGVDKFRIKIWVRATGAIVYDNVLGGSDDIDNASPQAISGGSIVIHSN